MAKIKIMHDQIAESLTIYFYEPTNNHLCEETDDGMILIRDEKTKKLLGFELLYYKPEHKNPLIIESVSFSEKTS
jgi:hypothetical protein